VNGKGDWDNRGEWEGTRRWREVDLKEKKTKQESRGVEGRERGGKIMRRRDIIYPHLIRRGSWNRRAIGTHTFTSSPQPELVHTAKKR
jgi:hypothetical protein